MISLMLNATMSYSRAYRYYASYSNGLGERHVCT
jgi:hypothetical protein